MRKIAIINGPNLNLTGQREPEIYGTETFEDLIDDLRNAHPDITLHYFSSNVEGELINALHEHGFDSDGIILNAGGYTHTSVAIADAIKAIKCPVIEVHMSNILSRESFRHQSLTGAYCLGTIMGLGMQGYRLAVAYLMTKK
jgi:3-dehydroquinate dehydratase II